MKDVSVRKYNRFLTSQSKQIKQSLGVISCHENIKANNETNLLSIFI